MWKVAAAFFLLFSFCAIGSASPSRVEVLYVEALSQPVEAKSLLYTYNVNPETASAEQVGPVLGVPTTSIDTLTIGSQHFIYLWNGTDVWIYTTNAQGMLNEQPLQHLQFGFPYPVISFLPDPDGKFAYAGLSWFNVNGNNAAVVLFTIDPSTGYLTNTGKVVATYGPNGWVPITKFLFGVSGRRLYSYEDYSGAPHSCGGAYFFYDVNRRTGSLGPDTPLVGWGDCGAYDTGTFSDTLTAVADAPLGRGSGTVVLNATFMGQTINCGPSMLAFCGDDAWTLSFDPASKNIFFGDLDTNLMAVGHIDFPELRLLSTTSTIPSSDLSFSPDSKLIYAVTETDINIYAFNTNTGNTTASSLLPRNSISAHIGTATLSGK